VTHRLLDGFERRGEGEGGRPERVAADLRATLLREGEGRRAFWPQDLHPSMIPILLGRCGYREKPPERPAERDTAEVSLGAVAFLAELRRNDEAPALERVAADRRQNSAARLTCLLALVAAGEPLDTGEALDVLGRDAKVGRRVVAVLALGYSKEPKVVAPVLRELRTDANRDIRSAAALALEALGPK
jgi:hypothetical protein